MTRAGAIDLDALAGRTLPLLPRPIERAAFVAELRERMYGAGGAVAVHQAGIVTALEAATVVAARVEGWLVEQEATGLKYGEWEAAAFVAELVDALEHG